MLLPAATELGEAEFVTTRSACVARATTSVAVALLFAAFGSVVDELIVAVSLIAVPAAVPAVTLTTTGKLAVPGAKLGFVQVIVPALPTAGVVQDHPAGNRGERNEGRIGRRALRKGRGGRRAWPGVRHHLRIRDVVARLHRNRARHVRNRKTCRVCDLNARRSAVVRAGRVAGARRDRVRLRDGRSRSHIRVHLHYESEVRGRRGRHRRRVSTGQGPEDARPSRRTQGYGGRTSGERFGKHRSSRRRRTVVGHGLRISNVITRGHRIRTAGIGHAQIRLRA